MKNKKHKVEKIINLNNLNNDEVYKEALDLFNRYMSPKAIRAFKLKKIFHKGELDEKN